MLTIVQQMATISRIALRESAQRAIDNRLKAERQAEIRAKQWASRKAGGNGVAAELLKRLPKTSKTAISMAQVKQLMSDLDTGDSSITGALSILVKDKHVERTGERRAYCYFVARGKKS